MIAMDATTRPNDDTNNCASSSSDLPALPATPPPLVPEQSEFLDGDAPAADKVQAFLARALKGSGRAADQAAAALVPWIAVARGEEFRTLVDTFHRIPLLHGREA